jgi:hypothetical protein
MGEREVDSAVVVVSIESFQPTGITLGCQCVGVVCACEGVGFAITNPGQVFSGIDLEIDNIRGCGLSRSNCRDQCDQQACHQHECQNASCEFVHKFFLPKILNISASKPRKYTRWIFLHLQKGVNIGILIIIDVPIFNKW